MCELLFLNQKNLADMLGIPTPKASIQSIHTLYSGLMALYGTVLLPVLKKHAMIETDFVSTVILDVSAQPATCSGGLTKSIRGR